MNKYDPNEVFINSFGHRIKKSGTKVDIDPLTVHCALLDNCFCTSNGDCGDNQICTTITGYNYLVCKTKNEIPINFFPKIVLPNGPDLLTFFASEAKNIATALLSECTPESLLKTLGDTTANSFGQFIKGIATGFKDLGVSVLENGIFSIQNLIPRQ